MNRERILKSLEYLIRAILVGVIVWAALSRTWEVLALSLGALFIITVLPFLIEKNYKLQLPLEFELYITFFAFASLFLGEAGEFYEKFWWWDVLLHTTAAMIAGLIAFVVLYSLRESGQLKARPGTMSIFIFTFALAIGAMWEIVEFTLDLLFNTMMQQGSLVDTMTDMIIDAAGAGFIAISSFLYLRTGHIGPFDYVIKLLERKNPQLFPHRAPRRRG